MLFVLQQEDLSSELQRVTGVDPLLTKALDSLELLKLKSVRLDAHGRTLALFIRRFFVLAQRPLTD
jgi:hypothetical protein